MSKHLKTTLFFFVFFPWVIAPAQSFNEADSLKIFFDDFNVEGCFILYDYQRGEYITYNQQRCMERFIPASTFKIFNSLAALETKVISDENEIIEWDGVDRQYEKWNQDLNLAQAFKYSAVWFYQELARRIGEERMNESVTENHYGNENIGGGIDRFWLDGELRISPFEQIEFLRKLYSGNLEFSERSIDVVKKIMIYDQTETYTIRAKTGWAMRAEDQIGWFVGYIENGDKLYFFCTNLQTKNPGEGFRSRIEITYNILKYLQIIPL